ncbi:MAG: FtsQ-type POTRA domain-containing protein [Candidatus Xiphinematobacter sp.]|nr:MAG: FtsQ-type POTRA domain-containing protein [Candidatus Xiphinematobacter sp.]
MTHRRSALLRVRVCRNTSRRRWTARVFNTIWQSTFLASLLIGGWVGAGELLAKFFYTNPHYGICHVRVNSESVFSDAEILASTGLQFGDNIFSVDLENARKKLLTIGQIQSVSLRRVLPNTLRVLIQLREPVAWLVSKEEDRKGVVPSPVGSLLLEAEGTFYEPTHILPRYLSLPIIQGINQKLLASGDLLAAEDLRHALELLRLVASRCDPPISLRLLDLSKGYCIQALGESNEVITFSTHNFEAQLDRLQELMKVCECSGRRIASVNLFVHRNTPVRFFGSLDGQPLQQNGGNIIYFPPSH